jgi:hypothetical protein
MVGVKMNNGVLMIGDYILEEIWHDGTGLYEAGNHLYHLPRGNEIVKIYTDKNNRVIEIERA